MEKNRLDGAYDMCANILRQFSEKAHKRYGETLDGATAAELRLYNDLYEIVLDELSKCGQQRIDLMLDNLPKV